MAALTTADIVVTNTDELTRSLPRRTTASSGAVESTSTHLGDRAPDLCLPFSTTNIDNADTYTHTAPIELAVFAESSAGAVHCAWDPSANPGVVTFTTSAANQTGYLLIWHAE
jgi:hypothetical protein